MRTHVRFGTVVCLLLCFSPVAWGQSYSTAPGGTPGLFDDHIWAPSGGPFPGLHISGAGANYNVDALCLGYASADWFFVQGIYFSVDYQSLGAPGTAVFIESGGAPNVDQAADAYFAPDPILAPGIHLQLHDGNGTSPPGAGAGAPGLSLGLAEAGVDNVDAFDHRNAVQGVGSVFFSFDQNTSPFVSGAAADVYVGPALSGFYDGLGSYATYAAAAALGLDLSGANSDELDGVSVFDDGDNVFGGGAGIDYVLFTLSPSSPALTNGSAYSGFSAADVLYADSLGNRGRRYTAAQLGVLATDNLDALDVQVIPEPGSAVLVVTGLVAMGLCSRPRRRS